MSAAKNTTDPEHALAMSISIEHAPDASPDTATGADASAAADACGVTVLYFASLREAAGRERETLAHVGDLAALYEALRARHGFALPRERLRVALDGAFAQWSDTPGEGAEIAFIPPVSGG